MWSFDFATLAALSALPQPSASRDPLPSTKPSIFFYGFETALAHRQTLSRQTSDSSPSAPPQTFYRISPSTRTSGLRHGLAVGLPPWPPQLWASCVATPGSDFAQKLPYRSETAVWPLQNPRTFSAASSRRLASVASPALGQLCGHARQRLRAKASLPFRDCRLAPSKPPNLLCSFQPSPCQRGLPSSGPTVWPGQAASLPFRDCRLAPSKPSNLLCSFQPSPCQLWPPQLWLASVASPALGQLCGHARQRDCRLAPSKPSNLLCSFQPSPCQRGLPSSGPTVWPRQAAA